MLSKEDKKDVKGAMGKAMANKIAKVTRDIGGKPFNRAKVKKGFTAVSEDEGKTVRIMKQGKC